MERHAVLRDLSRDHHTLLQHAARLESAVQAGPQEALKASRAFLDWWSRSLRDHLEEEAQFVVPKAAEHGVAGRFNMIEERLRNAVGQLQITMMDPQYFRASVLQVPPVLRTHVSFCEANLFEDVEDSLDEAAFAQLGTEMAAFRRARRPGSVGANRTEQTFLGPSTAPPA